MTDKEYKKFVKDGIRDYFDYPLEVYETPNFTEVIGTMGGDSRTFRFYKDGTIVER